MRGSKPLFSEGRWLPEPFCKFGKMLLKVSGRTAKVLQSGQFGLEKCYTRPFRRTRRKFRAVHQIWSPASEGCDLHTGLAKLSPLLARLTVNQELILLYLSIGRQIPERQARAGGGSHFSPNSYSSVR